MKWVPNKNKFRNARLFSNNELKKVAHLYSGKVLNVSASDDFDKFDRQYKDYFFNANEYFTSNFKGYKAKSSNPNELFLDLTQPLEEELNGAFDVVFNHTTLEHIFDIDQAFKNLCDLTSDTLIIVVPFMQEEHRGENSYSDYWRFTGVAIEFLFTKNKLDLIYLSANQGKNQSIYVFAVGTRYIQKWKNLMPMSKYNYPIGNTLGDNLFNSAIKFVKNFK